MNLCPAADGILPCDRYDCHPCADQQVLLHRYVYAHHGQYDCIGREANQVAHDAIDERLNEGFQSCLHAYPLRLRLNVMVR